MNSIFAGLCLVVLLIPFDSGIASENDFPEKKVGMLSCKILPHSGINLLIHSTRDIRCEFTPATSGPVEYYKGETGIGFGLDVAINKGSNITYLVLANHFTANSHQLAGKYSGARGSASLGVSAGDLAPIEKNDGSIALQPMKVKNQGIGVTLGFSYIYLEPDSQ